MINKIYDMILSDQRIKLCEIVKAAEVSKSITVSILQDRLNIRKISARWVPCLLSIETKHKSMITSEALLAHIRNNLNEFLHYWVATV